MRGSPDGFRRARRGAGGRPPHRRPVPRQGRSPAPRPDHGVLPRRLRRPRGVSPGPQRHRLRGGRRRRRRPVGLRRAPAAPRPRRLGPAHDLGRAPAGSPRAPGHAERGVRAGSRPAPPGHGHRAARLAGEPAVPEGRRLRREPGAVDDVRPERGGGARARTGRPGPRPRARPPAPVEPRQPRRLLGAVGRGDPAPRRPAVAGDARVVDGVGRARAHPGCTTPSPPATSSRRRRRGRGPRRCLDERFHPIVDEGLAWWRSEPGDPALAAVDARAQATADLVLAIADDAGRL